MTVLHRAATLAAVTLALAGLTGAGAPGHAAGLQATQAVAQLLPALPIDPIAQPAPAVAIGEAPLATVPAAFDTLDAAIAAQAKATEADDAVRCLAAAIYFEAKGEPVDGQLAVAEVIINRAKSGRFPDDVCDVVTQRGQFSFVRGGAIPAIDGGRAGYRTALAIARVAIADAWRSTAPQALYFHARSEPMSGRVVKVAAIGNHIFYR